MVSRWANGEGVRLVFIVGLTGDRSDDLMLSRGPVVEVYAKWKSWGEFVLVDEFGGKYEHDSVKILAGNEIKQFSVIEAAESCRLFDIALPEGIAGGMQSLKIAVSWEGRSRESGRPFRHACEVEVKPVSKTSRSPRSVAAPQCCQ